MPIYEFYCADCNTLFNFFSARIDTESRPACPRCGREELERRPAAFATPKHSGEEPPDPFDGLDEGALEGAMESLAGELESAEESEDPRKLASVFRKFGEASGMEMGPRMEEMLARLEGGEDPDALEEELGDELDDDDEAMADLFRVKKAAAAARRKRPRVDDRLYFL